MRMLRSPVTARPSQPVHRFDVRHVDAATSPTERVGPAKGVRLAMSWMLSLSGLGAAAFAQPPERVAVVEVCRVQQADIAGTSRVVATVVPTRRSVVGAAVDGRVDSFLSDPNSPERKLTRVSKGQTLAQLKTDTIARLVDAANAEVRLAEQKLAEQRNGALPEEIAAAGAQMARAQAQRTYVQSRYGRLKKLFEKSNTVSLDALEEAQSAVAQAEQSYFEFKAQHDLIVRGPRDEVIAQSEAELEMRRQTHQRLVDMMNKYTIRAPFDGYVVQEYTEIGAWVKQGDPVAEVIQLIPIEVEAFLPEKNIPQVRVGDPARVTFDARPDRDFEGIMHRIIPQADLKSRTFPIRIRLPASVDPEQERIMAGMLGRVFVQLKNSAAALLVPKDALVLKGSQRYVILVDPLEETETSTTRSAGHNGIARRVPVDIGLARGGSIEVRGDVQRGDWVVTRGNERMTDGDKVRWRPQGEARGG